MQRSARGEFTIPGSVLSTDPTNTHHPGLNVLSVSLDLYVSQRAFQIARSSSQFQTYFPWGMLEPIFVYLNECYKVSRSGNLCHLQSTVYVRVNNRKYSIISLICTFLWND